MPKTLIVEIVTPEKVALQGEAESVILPAHDGSMGVLPRHAPFLVMLNPGEVRVTAPGGATREFAVGGGFAEVRPYKVSVFAESAELPDEIDAERARQALERAKARVQAPGLDPLTLAQAEAAMKRAQVRLRVAELRPMRGGPVRRPFGEER